MYLLSNLQSQNCNNICPFPDVAFFTLVSHYVSIFCLIIIFWAYRCSTILILIQWVNSKIYQNLMDEAIFRTLQFFDSTLQFSLKNNILNWLKIMTLVMLFNPNFVISKKVISIYAVKFFTLFIWNHFLLFAIILDRNQINTDTCSTILILIQQVNSKICQNLMDEDNFEDTLEYF